MQGAGYQVEVHGSVGGNLVVGDHNLIVNAAVGSVVSVVQEAQRPKPVRRPRVRVLPRRPGPVLGRLSELGTITAAVVRSTTIQVYGPPGIGKSTLLRQASYDIADESDGVVFISAGGRSHLDLPQEIFEACYETSGYRPSPTEVRRLMSGVRACVIADDLVCSPDELATVLDAAPDAAFVLAAPVRELWGTGEVLELAGLSEEAALALVRHEYARELTPAEASAVIAECRAGAGSPMRLLRAAAALRRGRSVDARHPVDSAHPDSGHQPADSAQPVSGHQPVDGRNPAGIPQRATGRASVPVAGGAAGSPAAAGSVPPEGAAQAVGAPTDVATALAALPAAERDVHQFLAYIAPAAASVPVIAALVGAKNLGHVASAAERLVRDGLADRLDRAEVSYRLADDLAVPVADRSYRRDIASLVTAMTGWLTRPDVRPSDVSDHGDLIVDLIDAAVRLGHADHGSRLARTAAPLAALSLRWSVWRDVLTSGQAAATASDDREAYAYFTHERGIRLLCLGHAAAAAAVLATAAGLWHALGLTQAVAAATQAQAIATGTSAASGAASTGAAGPGSGSGGPGHPLAHPPGAPPAQPPGSPAQPPGPPGQPSPPPAHVVGSAHVGAAASGGAPVALITTIGVIIVALVVAAIVVLPKLGHHTAAATPTTQPTGSQTVSVSPAPSLPSPVAFSDDSANGSDPALVLDDDPSTYWSSGPQRSAEATDAWIGIDLGVATSMTGLSVTQRPDFAGFPSEFEIDTSDDGKTWIPVPGQVYNNEHPFTPAVGAPQVFMFDQAVQARFVRFFATYLVPPPATNVRALKGFELQLAEVHVLVS